MEHVVFEKNSQDNSINVSLRAMDNVQKNLFGKLIYKMSKSKDITTITFWFDETQNPARLQVDLPALNTATCLITCGLSLAGTILDCYKNHNGDWAGFLDCLEKQGHAVGMSTLACAMNCF